jgi:hypothetical protein
MIEFIILVCIIILGLYCVYRPSIDVITSNSHYDILLWYNRYDGDDIIRTYKKLFTI